MLALTTVGIGRRRAMQRDVSVGNMRDVSVGTQRCIGTRHCRRPLVSGYAMGDATRCIAVGVQRRDAWYGRRHVRKATNDVSGGADGYRGR